MALSKFALGDNDFCDSTSVDQIISFSSLSKVARYCPSGENEMQVTASKCSLRICNRFSVTCQMAIVPSSSPLINENMSKLFNDSPKMQLWLHSCLVVNQSIMIKSTWQSKQIHRIEVRDNRRNRFGSPVGFGRLLDAYF